VRLQAPGKSGGNAYMRNARRLDNGNYIVAHYGDQVVKEYDPQGRIIREIPAPGGPHSAIRLPNAIRLLLAPIKTMDRSLLKLIKKIKLFGRYYLKIYPKQG